MLFPFLPRLTSFRTGNRKLKHGQDFFSNYVWFMGRIYIILICVPGDDYIPILLRYNFLTLRSTLSFSFSISFCLSAFRRGWMNSSRTLRSSFGLQFMPVSFLVIIIITYFSSCTKTKCSEPVVLLSHYYRGIWRWRRKAKRVGKKYVKRRGQVTDVMPFLKRILYYGNWAWSTLRTEPASWQEGDGGSRIYADARICSFFWLPTEWIY